MAASLSYPVCFVAGDQVLWRLSSETVSFFLPLALLAETTFLPPVEAILLLKPCLFLLFLLDGWNVLFIFWPA